MPPGLSSGGGRRTRQAAGGGGGSPGRKYGPQGPLLVKNVGGTWFAGWSRRLPASALVAGLVSAAFLLASCGAGAGNPSSVAHLGKSSQTTTTVASAASSIKGNLQQMYQATLSYSECMRAHGMPNFPNPEVVNSGNVHGISMPAPGNRNSPQYTSADNRCKHLLPNGGAGPTQAQLQSMLNRALKFSKCMRAHGLPNFPDPHETSQGISIGSPGAGYGKGSPQFDAAQNACQSYLGGP